LLVADPEIVEQMAGSWARGKLARSALLAALRTRRYPVKIAAEKR